MDANAFRHVFDYHFAENRTIWDSAVTLLSDEQFAQGSAYSHGSVRDQLIHMISVDEAWFSGLRGVDLGEPEQVGDRQSIRAYGDRVEAEIRAYLGGLRDEMLRTKPIDEGEDKDLAVWQMLLQGINHGTDHRAQILRRQGVARMSSGQEMLWRQFCMSIDTLGEALRACPDALWQEQLWPDEPGQFVAAGFSSFWYLGYHALFWLDLYLTGAEEGFAPPAPFALVEMDAGEILPRVYGRDELLAYLALCRSRCEATIGALTPEAALRQCRFAWGELPFGELLLYNLRHVQEHAAHLQMFLGQRRPTTPVIGIH